MTKQCPEESAMYEQCPGTGDVVSFHTQIKVNGTLEIPDAKPPMEDIFSTSHEIDITKFTPVDVRKPAGKKVLVVGTISVGIEYIADVPDQKMHFAHWDLPFQALIKNDDGSVIPFDFDINDYVVHVCIEFEKYEKVDERHITKELVLLIWLQPKDN